MKKLLLPAIALAALAPALGGAATKGVDITRAGFTPNKVTIEFGDTVTWTNKDSNPHQVLADQLKFPTSPVLQANQTYSYTFNKSGNFGYRDALATNHKGSVVVHTGVTLAAAPRALTYGSATTLSGIVSSAASGETVTIDAKECSKTTFTKIATISSGANGAWTYAAKPTLATVYQANWKTAKSTPLTVNVRPKVVLKKLGARRFSATVSAAQSFVGKYVVLQRYVSSRRKWVTVKRVILRKVIATTPPTMNTSARFGTLVRRRTKLRLSLPQSQAGTCYAAATSNTVKA